MAAWWIRLLPTVDGDRAIAICSSCERRLRWLDPWLTLGGGHGHVRGTYLWQSGDADDVLVEVHPVSCLPVVSKPGVLRPVCGVVDGLSALCSFYSMISAVCVCCACTTSDMR